MVKVYYIKKRDDNTQIQNINNDISKNMKVICFIYWDKCGACSEVSPDWQTASSKFQQNHPENNTVIAYINKDALSQLKFDKEVHAFPHFSTIQGNKIKDFEPDRSVSGLMKFMEEESKKEKLFMGGGKTRRKQKPRQKKTRKNKKDVYYYPQSKMLESGYIKSGIHSVYYSCYGNKNGKPVLVVHGGPGGGTLPKMTKIFNPKKYYIILVDQRGCGKSTPIGERRNNNTHELIKDFEKIRKKLNIKKWMLYGGSWGTFLSLVYAVKHPSIVSEMVIRGIFLGGKDEIEWVNAGTGANYFFPDKWEDYIKQIPENERSDLLKAYGRRFEGELGNKIKDKALYNWAKWELSISKLYPMKDTEIKKELTKNDLYKSFAMLEYHYFKNNCFVPKNYLRNKQIYKTLKNIPIEIVHGRYDIVCPPSSAYELHNYIPHSKLHFTQAGHAASDLKNRNKLIEITDKYV